MILPPFRLPLLALNQYLDAPTFSLGGTITAASLQNRREDAQESLSIELLQGSTRVIGTIGLGALF